MKWHTVCQEHIALHFRPNYNNVYAKTMHTIKSFFRLPIFFSVVLFFTIAGCDSNDSNSDDAPDVIPAEVFTLPVDIFAPGANKSEAPGLNFTAAAFRVWPVSIIVSANMVLPSLLTLQALDTEPVFEDGSWLWVSEASNLGQSISFTLSASRDAGDTVWSMSITYNDIENDIQFDNYELFTARTSNNGQSGSWSLFYPLEGMSQNVLNATYSISSDDERQISFSIPPGAFSNSGDSVVYSESGDERTFDWRQVSENIETLVMWNSSTNAGHITATDYNNGTQGCWDTELEDVDC